MLAPRRRQVRRSRRAGVAVAPRPNDFVWQLQVVGRALVRHTVLPLRRAGAWPTLVGFGRRVVDSPSQRRGARVVSVMRL
jgi:hypothetical protein